MIESIHQSMISMALKCQEQFRRRYIEGEIIPPGIAMGVGSAVHKANEVNLSQKTTSGVDLPPSVLHDAARDEYFHVFKNGLHLHRDQVASKNNLLNQGLNSVIGLTTLYHEQVAPEIDEPVSVEESFLVDIGADLPIGGRIDFATRDGSLFDLKTSGRSWAPQAAETKYWLQPAMYTLSQMSSTPREPSGFTYYVLVNLKKEEKKLQTFILNVGDSLLKRLLMIIANFCKMLKTGVFMPADPSHWVCSEQYCGYYLTCKYTGH